MEIEKLSPMMKHYLSVKEKHPDCIILYRLGDFYEMFFDDAKEASKILDITLTGRDCGLDDRAPMCGVPYHAVDAYIAKLIEAGKKVGICEQLTKPQKGVMVSRDVIRIITPGTVIEDNILEKDTNNYLCSVYYKQNSFGVSWADISTGEINTTLLQGKTDEVYLPIIEEYLLSIMPKEIICDCYTKELLSKASAVVSLKLPTPTEIDSWVYTYNNCYSLLLRQFNVKTLISFEIEDKELCVYSSGALIHYINETQKRNLTQLIGLKYKDNREYLTIDSNSKRNLEIFETLRDRKKKGSLYSVLDKTQTALGARCLRKFLEEPSRNEKIINDRLDSVGEFIAKITEREKIIEIFSNYCDLERLCSKLAYRSINPKELLRLGECISLLPKLKDTLRCFQSKLIKKLNNTIDPLLDVSALILKAISDKAPITLKDGNVIKEGYCSELDEYRDISNNGTSWIAALEQTERESTGIKTLKIRFNKNFGYFIEVSKSYIGEVPFRYLRKQTLTNGERYTTPELKELEEKILTANDKAVELEQALYDDILNKISVVIPQILLSAKAIAQIDVLQSFAVVSLKYGYTRPIINNKIKEINIKEGCHPVILSLIGNDFVCNDTLLDLNDNRTMVITGPNMAGKSTYMRQIALIALMAHIGCFVPCKFCEMCILDRIFTRVGASDDLTYGLSTFMIEMLEVATILNYATGDSLILLDEIGRGTSTYDGLSIAWSVLEYVNNKILAKTLFATHYHELTELEGVLHGVKNYRVLVNELNNSVVFLHRIVRGGANKSFGIEVAALAGVPKAITSRAKEISKALEITTIKRDTNAMMLDLASTDTAQIQFFDDETDKAKEILRILQDTDINECSPMQCFTILKDLIEKARKN